MRPLSGYQILDQLYVSARTQVARATRVRDGAPVIIKRPSDGVVFVEATRRIMHEQEILRRLASPCEVVREGTDVALVLPDHGGALAELMRSRPTLAVALDIACQLVRDVERIHAAGIVHRDINPNNVTVDPATQFVRVIDFDIATHGPLAIAASQQLEGTLRYMAPEQTGRVEQRIDARTDLYSIGATLYELFTGTVAFDGTDALAIVHAHLAVAPRRIDEIEPAIPAPLADIVEKLLEKTPDRRYQSASALAQDLERCRREYAATSTIEPFTLALDAAPRFEIPDRLYGREDEIRELHAAFERAAHGECETVLVAGYSGVGKSSVVRELFGTVAARGGYVASGKFDQLHHDIPYSAIATALDELVALLLGEDAAALERWSGVVAGALGADVEHAIAVVPSLARLLGRDQASATTVPDGEGGTTEALARLIHALAGTTHPLVLFLDDMQWADNASLQLLTLLVTSEDTEALLIVEAYRDNETHATHPYTFVLADREKRGARMTKIALAPLDQGAATDLVADTLRAAPEVVATTGAELWRRTEGNPFFLRQLLRSLYDEGHLVFDRAAGHFTIDAASIDAIGVTENVAELLARTLGKLPAATRSTLGAAATIGNRFDVAMLAMACEQPRDVVRASLAPAIQLDMIQPLGDDRFAFQHDRLQQAAYELQAPEIRERTHLVIGRALLGSSSPEQVEERVFDIVHHLSRAIASVVDPAERTRLLQLELVAARRARRSGAFDVAASILASAATLVTWDDYATCLEVQLLYAEALALDAKNDAGRAVLHAALARAHERDRFTLEALDSEICTHGGKTLEAVAAARRAAALLGIDLPSEPGALDRMIQAEIGEIMARIAESPVEEWLELPTMTDSEALSAAKLLVATIPTAYQAEPALLVLISAKLVTLSQRYGNCASSARGYCTFAIVCWAMGQFELSYRFGRLGVDLSKRLGDHPLASSVDFVFAAFNAPWKRPLDEAIEILRGVTTERAVDGGDTVHAGYAALFAIEYRMLRGDPLDDVLAEAMRYYKMALRLGLSEIESTLRCFAWHARERMGRPHEDGFHPNEIEHALEYGGGSASMLALLRGMKLELTFWRGDHAGVLAQAEIMEPGLATIVGNAYNGQHRLYVCLSAVALGRTADERFARAHVELAAYAQTAPENFGHMIALVDAELARVRGDVGEALRLYDTAIDGAAEQGFLKVEALAHRLAAAFWAGRERPAFAEFHRERSRALCEHWGFAESQRVTSRVEATMSTAGRMLDLASVVKASNALSSEVILDSLLLKFMAIILENTGAQTGSILLERDGQMYVHARKELDRDAEIVDPIPLGAAPNVSERVVNYATRTNTCVLVANATRHQNFRIDPYVQTHRPKSILCLPIVNKDRVTGAIYVENNLITGAFTEDRVAALGILVAQLGISVENAVMFARVATYRDHLQELVDERTRALVEANNQLRREYVERERMQSELRLAQKLQSVGQLAAGVAHEINTPIQFVGNSVEFLRDAVASLVEMAQPRTPAEIEDLDDLRVSAPEAITLALDGIARVTRITRALNEFSHPDSGEQTPTNLNAAIESSLAVSINAYKHVADIALDLGDMPEVRCHPGEVNQVLLNLITNAAHAIEDVVGTTGGRGRIEITSRLEGDTAVIVISDTGGGIPEGVRDRVFDPFFTTKEVGRGTGQGLGIARTSIVDRHGGTLEFETETGRGTTFYVRLPIQGHVVARSAA